jgi:hypothetical protein
MHRYQIYLDDEHRTVLSRLSTARGCSMSDLVREAIDLAFRNIPQGENGQAILDRTCGAWKGRIASGSRYVAQLRSGRRWNRRLTAQHGRRNPDRP